jgi:hypothetical protein
MECSFTAPLWKWDSTATSWFFVSVPFAEADAIDAYVGSNAKGFGSVPVEVTIGATTFKTSLFPSKEQETFVLPVKKQVRTANKLVEGSDVSVSLVVAVDPAD